MSKTANQNTNEYTQEKNVYTREIECYDRIAITHKEAAADSPHTRNVYGTA